MAFADCLGAVGAFLPLPEGATGTTTIESKTNFLGAGPVGSVLVGEAVPVKIGKRLSVWQTRIRTEAGTEVALVTQTQDRKSVGRGKGGSVRVVRGWGRNIKKKK